MLSFLSSFNQHKENVINHLKYSLCTRIKTPVEFFNSHKKKKKKKKKEVDPIELEKRKQKLI